MAATQLDPAGPSENKRPIATPELSFKLSLTIRFSLVDELEVITENNDLICSGLEKQPNNNMFVLQSTIYGECFHDVSTLHKRRSRVSSLRTRCSYTKPRCDLTLA